MPKKNSPGCGCCSPCLNEDATTFTGLEISNCPTFNYVINGVTYNSGDANGVYLWSSVWDGPTNPFCPDAVYPTNYRLGSTIAPATCCFAAWKPTDTITTASTGITYPYSHSGTNYTATVHAEVRTRYELIVRSSTSSVSYGFYISMNICLYDDIPAGRGRGAVTEGSDVFRYVPNPDIGSVGTNQCFTYSRNIGFYSGLFPTLTGEQSVVNVSGSIVRPATLSFTLDPFTGSPFKIDKYRLPPFQNPVFVSSASYTETSSIGTDPVDIDFELLE
jgi:hypothetical protein